MNEVIIVLRANVCWRAAVNRNRVLPAIMITPYYYQQFNAELLSEEIHKFINTLLGKSSESLRASYPIRVEVRIRRLSSFGNFIGKVFQFYSLGE